MKKISNVIACLILALFLATVVFADDWKSHCKGPCPLSVINRIAVLEGTTNFDCCDGCWEYESDAVHGSWCGYRWEVYEQISPLPNLSPLQTVHEPTPSPTPEPTPVPEMPEWYYQPYGFPCEYLNPGNQDCICFCDAPMYCP